jgi:hypothetical protein
LDGPLPKLCPAVVLSNQDGCRSAVALLLKAALIQVSDYRLLGASGCFARLHCNLLNWSYFPFLFCAIALQSIKLELPPFFILCAIALQSIKLELPLFFILRDCIAIY